MELGMQASIEEILFGPGRQADGTTNLVGALRRAMATTGYSDVKEFQRVEVVVSPYLGQSTQDPSSCRTLGSLRTSARGLGVRYSAVAFGLSGV